MAGQISLKANSTTVTALGSRVSTAEVDIDGLQSQISLKADKVALQGYVTISNLKTAGTTIIDGGNITAGTITGRTVRTSSSGNRVQLDSTNLKSYYNSIRRVQLDYDSLDFFTASNLAAGTITSVDRSEVGSGVTDLEVKNDAGYVSLVSGSGTNYSSLRVNKSLWEDGGVHAYSKYNSGEARLSVQDGYIYAEIFDNSNNSSFLEAFAHEWRFYTTVKLGVDAYAVDRFRVYPKGDAAIYVDDNAGGYTDITIRPSITNRGNLGSGTYYFNNAYSRAWNQGSRRDTKEDIQVYDEALAYEQLKDIPLYTYSFKDGQYKDHNVGTMIDFMPIEIVDTTEIGRTEKGEIGMWATSSAIFFNMAATKELQRKVERLEADLEELKYGN